MDSVQFLRSKAKDAGNLSSNEQQIVTSEAAPPPPQPLVVTAPRRRRRSSPSRRPIRRSVFVPIYNPVHVFGPWWHPLFPPFFFPPPPRWGFGWNPVSTAIWWGVGIGVTNALWGGVDWRRRNVNINVNQWNNINVNNRINSNNRNVNWDHNPGNRRGVPYRDANTRDRMQQNRLGDRGGRQEYRGREDQRAQARAALSDRVGAENLDREALRNIDRNQIPQRTPAGDRTSAGDRAAAIDRSQARDRVGNLDRSQVQDRASNIDRSQVRDRASTIDRSQAQERASNIDRSRVQDRAANIDRSQVQNRAVNVDRRQAQNRNASAARTNRDNALRGANDGRQTRQQIDRGRASQAAQRHNATPQRQSRVARPAGGAVAQRRNQ
jgi:hypothetical protein